MSIPILIIENDDYDALKLTEYLRTAGYEVSRAKSGQRAIGMMRTAMPSIIILSDDLTDMHTDVFLERMEKLSGKVPVPILLMVTGKTGNGGHPRGSPASSSVAAPRTKGLIRIVEKPVSLDKVRSSIESVLGLPKTREEKRLTAEVFLRDGIIVIELRGYLQKLDLVALKYRILDVARADQSLTKRFYIIIYELEKDGLNEESFSHIFDFVSFFKNMASSNYKILTSNPDIRKMLEANPVTAQFEIVDSYIDGIDKLKSLYLKGGEEEVRVEFLQPDAALFKDVYDRKGNLIKEKGQSFSQDELDSLKRSGVKTLFYTRKARVDENRQIVADENVDVVLDAIRLTGIMIPDQLMETESKQRLTVKVLIVNSDTEQLDTLYGFFTSRGFSVHKIDCIREALKAATKTQYDFSIVDLDLEDGSGLDFVRTMKQLSRGTPCNYILTGKTVKAETVKEAVSLGIKGFLKSPFDIGKLETIIK
jgi:DNA-binding response OmpR family regulator